MRTTDTSTRSGRSGRRQATRSRGRRAKPLAGALAVLAALLACTALDGGLRTARAEPHALGPPVPAPGEARWLAGDHHVHSRYSVAYDDDRPTLGGDAWYPIPMNVAMARRFGLSWMVTTDHGGPGHSRIAREHIYPELLASRAAIPEVVQFYGMELNTPGADHSTWIVPRTEDEADVLFELESRFDTKEVYPRDPERNTEQKMLEALRLFDGRTHKPVVFANHPSRSASGLGDEALDDPDELRRWNDTAPGIAVGMEGAPGHQAAAFARAPALRAAVESFAEKLERRGWEPPVPRGIYFDPPTRGGFDVMTAELGGFWDSMLGEGRRWWITANSDSHIHHTEGGADFWPGEYSKTWVHAQASHESVLDGLRHGRIFVATGDLVNELALSARSGAASASIGGALAVAPGATVEVEIRFLDPAAPNAHGDRPRVHRVDLIQGAVRGPVADPTTRSNPTTRVLERFVASGWAEGERVTLRATIEDVREPFYLRLRGTNTAEPEPEPDERGEDPWDDLWFYSNPVFVELE